jgi:hypothetical protein
VSIVKTRQVPGDMPPIIAGDFNCHAWNQRSRNLIYGDFREAAGMNEVLVVFVGRPKSFLKAPGIWQTSWPSSSLKAAIDVRGQSLGIWNGEQLYEWTDHRMATAALTADLSLSPAEVDWPRDTSSSGGCWP